MDRQRIRPSLRDLADDYEQLAFPELQQGTALSVKITRTKPPAILASTPPPIPVVSTLPNVPQEEPAAPKAKTKSRFALQREKEAAERAARSDRFELDLESKGALPKQSNVPRLVGQVVERDTSSTPPIAPFAPGPSILSPLAERAPATGFPASSHLLFPRKPASSLSTSTPTEEPFDSPGADPQSLPSLLSSVSAENDEIIRSMTEAEILEEQRQIRESMGLSEAVIKMLEARGGQKVQPVTSRRRPAPEGMSPTAPPQEKTADAEVGNDEDEGSPEYIRRHFFPSEPANSNLDWMKASSGSSTPSNTPHAFNLQGALLPPSTADVTPAASTSHHVSSSSNFTIPSLLALTTSSVPSQRSTSLLVLGRVLANSSTNEAALGAKAWTQLRLDVAQKAGWALRDKNSGTVSVAISLLSALFESEAKSPSVRSTSAPGAEEPATILSSFLSTSPLPFVAEHLSHATVPPSSLLHLLSLLSSVLHLANPHRAVKVPELDILLDTPYLLEAVSKRFIARPWPTSTDEHESTALSPTPSALVFLADVARSSRDAAKALCDRKLLEPPLRFLGIPPWELEVEQQALGYRLVSATFELWETAGRYGIGADMRTKGASVLEAVGERVGSLLVEGSATPGEEEINMIRRWFSLLRVWTIAAIDPHVTEHDILWTHVDEFGASAMAAARWALARGSEESTHHVLTSALELLASWLEGSKVNQGWRGEKQREWVKHQIGQEFQQGGEAISLVQAALVRLATSTDIAAGADLDASLVAAALQLSASYEEDSNPPTPALFAINPDLIDPVFASQHLPGTRAMTSLLVALLPLLPSAELRLSRTLLVLRLLQAGDEVVARDLIDWVLKALSAEVDDAIANLNSAEVASLRTASILRPFFTHAIIASSSGRVVGPLYPSSRDLKLTASLHPFARQVPILGADWPLVAFNELLRSGTSEVFKQLPKDWDATELEVVRSSLALMRVVVNLGGAIEAPLLVYDLIKVFMLEKDNTTSGVSGAEAEVFREQVAQHSMAALLNPLRIATQPPQLLLVDDRKADHTMEGVSSLISSAPFYQLYTDLVGLYDSISLSHDLFGVVLLPSLAMAYPIDYRKLLWIDYTHLLRMLSFPTLEAISDRLGEGALASYLEPKEKDESLLGAYADALVSHKIVKGSFLELIATHHVSSALFGGASASEAMGSKLASAIVGQGSEEMVKRLLAYEQVTQEGEQLRLGDEALVIGGAGWDSRRQRLQELAGEKGAVRLQEWGL